VISVLAFARAVSEIGVVTYVVFPIREHYAISRAVLLTRLREFENMRALLSYESDIQKGIFVKRFVIIGSGPVGSTTAEELVRNGYAVDLITRSGKGPSLAGITRHALDATDAQALTTLASGATAIINAANPPYTKWATEWPPLAASILAAAERSGAGLVTMSNLYGHGPQHQRMTAHTPMDSTGTKGRVRADMWAAALLAHQEGRARTAEVRASDFFGPKVTDANIGQRIVPRILDGRKVQLLGKTDVAHSFSYMPDVARTLARVASNETAWGRAWLVPSCTITQREMIGALCFAAKVTDVKISTMPEFVLKALGVAIPLMRELTEVSYQFAAPFVVDATETTSQLGIAPTPIAESALATVGWYRKRSTD
jgi:nucleoside-diphosphate-sugar epimerase